MYVKHLLLWLAIVFGIWNILKGEGFSFSRSPVILTLGLQVSGLERSDYNYSTQWDF